jgi:hypothetical protein
LKFVFFDITQACEAERGNFFSKTQFTNKFNIKGLCKYSFCVIFVASFLCPQGTLYTNTNSLPRGAHGYEIEKTTRLSYNSSQREQPQQQQQQQSASTSNYSTNTLPKNHHQQQPASQQIYGKVTNPSRSMITDVVNKVPSVIMLPLPQQQQQLQHQLNQQQQQQISISSNQMKGISTNSAILKTSSSKDNLCDGNDGVISRETGSACHSQNSTLKRNKSKKEIVNANEKVISSKSSSSVTSHEKMSGNCGSGTSGKSVEKPLPVLTTSTNCTNPKEHFLPNETSLDDDYLSECENCKAVAGTGSRYYLDDEEIDEPLQETMTLQRKLMNENDENDQQNYYRVSSTLPTNTNKKAP